MAFSWQNIFNFVIKVLIFWEGHKNLAQFSFFFWSSYHWCPKTHRAFLRSWPKKYSILSLKFKYCEKATNIWRNLPFLSYYHWCQKTHCTFLRMGKRYSILSIKFKYCEKATNIWRNLPFFILLPLMLKKSTVLFWILAKNIQFCR